MQSESQQEMQSQLLTISESARLLRLAPATIRDWTLKRKIPFVKIGRLVRLRREDVEEVIRRSIVPAQHSKEIRP
jgi:excisionase family DNA binding protein